MSWFYSSAPAAVRVQVASKGVEPLALSWTSDEAVDTVCARLEQTGSRWQLQQARQRARLRVWAEGALPAAAAPDALRPLLLLLDRQPQLAAAVTVLKAEEPQIAASVGTALPLLPSLQSLNLTGVNLVALPPDVCRGGAHTLRRLVLRQNRLVSLPTEVGHLSALEHLDVSQNAITALPSELAQCTALAHLCVEDNAIVRLLPTAFVHLEELQTLLVAYNPLNHLPQLVPLSNLRRISVVDFEVTADTVAAPPSAPAVAATDAPQGPSVPGAGVGFGGLDGDGDEAFTDGDGERSFAQQASGSRVTIDDGAAAGEGASGRGAGMSGGGQGIVADKQAPGGATAAGVGCASGRRPTPREVASGNSGAGVTACAPGPAAAGDDGVSVLAQAAFPLRAEDGSAAGVLRVRVAQAAPPPRTPRAPRPHAKRLSSGRVSELQQSVAELCFLALRSTACQHPLLSSALALLAQAEPGAVQECLSREEGLRLMLQSMMLSEEAVVAQHACAVVCAVAAASASEAISLVDCGVGGTVLQLLTKPRSPPSVQASALEAVGALAFASQQAAVRLVAQVSLFNRIVAMCASPESQTTPEDVFAGAAAYEPGAGAASSARALESTSASRVAPAQSRTAAPTAVPAASTTATATAIDRAPAATTTAATVATSQRSAFGRPLPEVTLALRARALRTLGQLAFCEANVDVLRASGTLMRTLHTIAAERLANHSPEAAGWASDRGVLLPHYGQLAAGVTAGSIGPEVVCGPGAGAEGMSSLAAPVASAPSSGAGACAVRGRAGAAAASPVGAAAGPTSVDVGAWRAGEGAAPSSAEGRARESVWHAAVQLLALLGQNSAVERATGHGPHAGAVPRPVRLLALDGGGMRALVTIAVLRRLEKVSGRRIAELFDLIVGTSAGGIIAALLCNNKYSLAECESLFQVLGKRIFSVDARVPDAESMGMGGVAAQAGPASGVDPDEAIRAQDGNVGPSGAAAGGGASAPEVLAAQAGAAGAGQSFSGARSAPGAGASNASKVPPPAAGQAPAVGVGWTAWLGDVYKSSVEQLGGVRALLYGSKYDAGVMDGLLHDFFRDDLLVQSASLGVPRFCAVSALVSMSPACPYLFRNYTHTRGVSPLPRPPLPAQGSAQATCESKRGTSPGGRARSQSVDALSLARHVDGRSAAGARPCASPGAGASIRCDAPEPTANRGDCKTRVWQAIRCTSAAPYYFDDVLLGTSRFQDGGLVANNPSVLAVREARRLWPDRRVGVVVSVGTGAGHARPRELPWRTMHIGSVLLEQATSTELVDDALQALCALVPDLVYERLQPVDGRCEIGLDTTSPDLLASMLDAAHEYLDSPPVRARLERISEALAEAEADGGGDQSGSVDAARAGRLGGRHVLLVDTVPAREGQRFPPPPAPDTEALRSALSARGIPNTLVRGFTARAMARGSGTADALSANVAWGKARLFDALEADPKVGLVYLSAAPVRGGVCLDWETARAVFTRAQAEEVLAPVRRAPHATAVLGAIPGDVLATQRVASDMPEEVPCPLFLWGHRLQLPQHALGDGPMRVPEGGQVASAADDGDEVNIFSKLQPLGLDLGLDLGVLTASDVRARPAAWRDRIVLSRAPLGRPLEDALLDAGARAVISTSANAAPVTPLDEDAAGSDCGDAPTVPFTQSALNLIVMLRCGHGAAAACADAGFDARIQSHAWRSSDPGLGTVKPPAHGDTNVRKTVDGGTLNGDAAEHLVLPTLRSGRSRSASA